MSQLKVNSIVPVGGLPSGAAGGGIIQTVTLTKTDTASFTSNETEIEFTGFQPTITPSSNSSKILIIVSLTYGSTGTTYKGRLKRGSTDIFRGDASGSRQRGTFGLGFCSDENQADVATFIALDSPATTSAITYKLFFINDNNTALFINRSANDRSDDIGGRHVSTFTLMEITG
tara:strand:- start:327 stop:848 length:522 start_codon:yes stop_codon:yes gene_type:complete